MPRAIRGPFAILMLILLGGCASPEDGRPRAGGRGADAGNYARKPLHVPSKIDATRTIPRLPR